MSKQIAFSKRGFRSILTKMCAIAGIATIAATAQTDLARGKTASASSVEGSYVAANAVDGNSTSRWGSQFQDNQWLMVDLGATYSISSVNLAWEAASARDYQIQTSASGNDPWTTIATRSNMAGGSNRTDNITGLSASSRYIRMFGTARTTAYGFSLFSFEVYGGSSNYTLSTTVSPAASGTVTLNPAGGSYASGTVVTVTASSGSGYQFSNWSGDLSGTTSSTTITMTANRSVTANFTPVSGYQAGDMLYYNGTTWTKIPIGSEDQILTCKSGKPVWATSKITDVDGNVYTTVTIGTQTWMVENLKTTRFSDGTSIPNVTDGPSWGSLTTPGYCWYNNDESANKATHGALYNGYAVNTGKLAPAGWHVPTDADWSTLSIFLGGDAVAGGKLKEAGSAHWTSPNTGTNDVGFSALGGGVRNRYSGAFGVSDGYGSGGAIKDVGHWWTSTVSDNTNYFRKIYYDGNAFSSGNYWGRGDSPLACGFSVRCVRN